MDLNQSLPPVDRFMLHVVQVLSPGARLDLRDGLMWGFQQQLLPNLPCCDRLLADVDGVSFSGFCLCAAVSIQTEIPLRWRMAGFSVTDPRAGQRQPPEEVMCNDRPLLTELSNGEQHPAMKSFKIGVLNIPIIEKACNCYKL